MNYIEALRLTHSILRPINYCEIGCRFGSSLTLASCPSIGIDPDFDIRATLGADMRLYRMTSDAFFANHDPVAIFGSRIDMAFIDGMHLAEFALRDFANIERAAHSCSAILIDDLLPGKIEYASRERETRIWTGDVYRMILALRQYRSDLNIRIYDVEMKGFGLVTGLDPSSTVLFDKLDEIESAFSRGHWTLDSSESIRAQLRPLPVECLAKDLGVLALERS